MVPHLNRRVTWGWLPLDGEGWQSMGSEFTDIQLDCQIIR